MDGVDVNYRLMAQKMMIFLPFLGIPQLGEHKPFADDDHEKKASQPSFHNIFWARGYWPLPLATNKRILAAT